jgi:hypothetical protein
MASQVLGITEDNILLDIEGVALTRRGGSNPPDRIQAKNLDDSLMIQGFFAFHALVTLFLSFVPRMTSNDSNSLPSSHEFRLVCMGILKSFIYQ